MLLKCKRCKNVWFYSGKKTPNKAFSQWVACPRCHSSVKLRELKRRYSEMEVEKMIKESEGGDLAVEDVAKLNLKKTISEKDKRNLSRKELLGY